MKEEQFSEMMGKLEEIRCGIIDVETASEIISESDLTVVRNLFFIGLEEKTGWGRNEIKELFDDVVSNAT